MAQAGETDRLEAKLTALLAIVIDQHLRDTGLAKPRPRSIDQILADAGLSIKEISALLGKTTQAVGQALKSKAPKGRTKSAKRTLRQSED